VSIPLSNHVKILGAVLDPRITLAEHTKAVSKSCFYHIHAPRHIRGSLDHLTIRTIAVALVSTRLDYANSILYGIHAKHISRSQCTQNTLACVVTGKQYTDSSPSILKELHWLPIDACIKFKIAMLIFKALNIGNPPYLASLLHWHAPCRTLRSASANLLSVTRCNCHLVLVVSIQLLLSSGICVLANVHSCVTLSTFRRHIKSHLFSPSSPLPSDPSQCLWFSMTMALYKFTYLLTYLNSLSVLMYAIPALKLTTRQVCCLNACWNSVIRRLFGYHKWESVRAVLLGLGKHLIMLHKVKFYRHLFQSCDTFLCDVFNTSLR